MKKSQYLYESEVHKNLIHPLESYKGRDVKILHSCLKCGYQWQARPSNLITDGSGCPNCWKLSKQKGVVATKGEDVRYFESVKEATEKLGLYAGGVSKSCNGKLDLVKSWKFEFIDK